MSIAIGEFRKLAPRYLMGSMDVAEIRRANLLGVLADFRTLEELAEHYDLVANYLSQIKSGSRNMGSRFAREWEKKMKKPKGWLDTLQFGTPDDAMAGIEVMQIFQSLSPEDRESWLKHGRLLGGSSPKGDDKATHSPAGAGRGTRVGPNNAYGSQKPPRRGTQ